MYPSPALCRALGWLKVYDCEQQARLAMNKQSHFCQGPWSIAEDRHDARASVSGKLLRCLWGVSPGVGMGRGSGTGLGKGAGGGALGDLPMDCEEITVREARSWRSGQATGQDKTGEVWSPPFHRQRHWEAISISHILGREQQGTL